MTRVVCIDDHDIAIKGIGTIFHDSGCCELVAGFHTVDEFLAAQVENIDCVLLDLRLQDDSDPYDNVQRLQAQGFPVLILSALESPYLMRRAMLAGVNGMVQKSASVDTLREAVTMVAEGKTYATADWAALIDSDPLVDSIALSARQLEVLELYAMGEPAKRVASITGLSAETVQDYLTRIRTKYASVGRPAPTKVHMYQRGMEDGFIPGPHEKSFPRITQ